jgi:PKD repeat protein
MTWGRKNGDAGNCASYPVICTYEGMQMRLRQSYLEMCQLNAATCSPVGVAWRTFRNAYPLVELYNADESHPAENGTYLAACTFYSTIYQKSCVGATYVLAAVADSNATRMQTIASATVLDSIENWQQYGNLPFASFNFSTSQNQLSFANTSLRSSKYSWDFGDGSVADTMINPTHAYISVGTYTVRLTAKNNCNKYSTITKTITISTVPNGINELADNTIFFAKNTLFLKDKFAKISVQNTSGQLALEKNLSANSKEIDCSFLPKGLYFYQAINEMNKVSKGKFLVQ